MTDNIEILVVREDLRIIEALKKVQLELMAKFPIFPYQCCVEACTIAETLPLGLTMTYGFFVDDSELGYNHHWLLGRRKIWDITAHQFDGVNNLITVCKEDSVFAKERYLEGGVVMY